MASDESDTERDYWEAVAFVKRSEQRREVLQELDSPAIPKEIAEETDMYPSHVSRALRKLREEDIVEVINPDDRKGRLYRLTDTGEAVYEEVT